MSGAESAAARLDGPLLRTVRAAALACAILGGAGTVAIMVLINADVIGRGAFNAPLPATAEIVSAAIVTVVFLQLPYATAMGRNIRSDMLLARLEAARPRAALLLDALHHAVGTATMAILLRYVTPEVLDAVRHGETVGLYGVFQVPRAPFVLAVLLGAALTTLVFALLTAGLLRAALAPAGRAEP